MGRLIPLIIMVHIVQGKERRCIESLHVVLLFLQSEFSVETHHMSLGPRCVDHRKTYKGAKYDAVDEERE
jgi:hypothetical protein